MPRYPALTPNLGLDTVPENPEVEYPELNPNDAPDAATELNEDEFDVSSSAHSGITSYTQYELSKLNQESMINALPFLYQYADSLLNLFASADTAQLERLHEDLKVPNSRASRRLSSMLEGFMLNRVHYGDDTSIDLEIVIRALAGLHQTDELPEEVWRPDAVLYMANLARYISTMYASGEGTDPARELLMSMFNSFPAPFGKIPGNHQTNLDETLLLVLELRTQYMLQELSERQHHPAFDPDETLRAVFYVEYDQLRGLDYHNELSSLPPTFEAIFTKRIAAIRRHFSNDINNPVDFDGLRKAFPYVSFLVHLARWAQLMTKQHKSIIADIGGISQIQSQLQDELERQESAEEEKVRISNPSEPAERQVEEQGGSQKTIASEVTNPRDRPDPAGLPARKFSGKEPPGKAPKKKSDPRNSRDWRTKQMQSKKELEDGFKARKAKKAAKTAQASSSKVVEAPAHDVQPSGDDEPVPPSPMRIQSMPALSQQGRIVLATLEKQAAQSNKENIDTSRKGKYAFLDKQPGAVRVDFDSEDEVPANSRKSPSKRKAQEIDDDEEGDDFEVDTRTTKVVPRRRIEIEKDSRRPNTATHRHQSRSSPSKRARIEDDEDIDEEEDDDNLAASSQLRREEASRNRHGSASSLPPTRRIPLHERHNDPPSSSAPGPGNSAAPPIGTQVSAVNQEARQNTAKRLIKKPTQQRSRWTDEEVQRLVELIEDHGVSWVNLLRMDGERNPALLQHRDQGSLKDKARNMKMDFLKYVFLCTILNRQTTDDVIGLVWSCQIISSALL